MGMSEWAKREVELACENEKKADCDCLYAIGCYKSALKAYDSLLEDGHSGLSINITKNILLRLIDGLPLTPIEDTDDVWIKCGDIKPGDGSTTYQCTRMSSLFKDVYPDGSIKYHDNRRCYCADINSEVSYSCGLASRLINEMFPISMPYYPSTNQFKVYCSDFLSDEKNGDFDTVAIWYVIKPDGERMDLNKYYKESDHSWVEIDKNEYKERYENRVERN